MKTPDNPLAAFPIKWRLGIYTALALIGLALGALNVGMLAAGAMVPGWLTGALAAVPFLLTGLGFTAATHVPAAPDAEKRPYGLKEGVYTR